MDRTVYEGYGGGPSNLHNLETQQTSSDEELAWQLYRREEADLELAIALSRSLESLEITRDRALAIRLAAEEGNLPPEVQDELPQNHQSAAQTPQTLTAQDGGDPIEQASIRGHGNRTARAQHNVACSSCMEDFPRPQTFTPRCGHPYCRDCLASVFERSMTDETMFPPRCCRNNFALQDVRHLLGPDLTTRFEVKAVELSTANRTYCHHPQCSTFIPPAMIVGDVGRCGECGRSTCAMCKDAAHQGDCPNDEVLQQVLQTAAREGWRRCGSCNRMIELNQGCNHMTCHCGYHFCYVCGWRWRTCRCPLWNEDRLYARAEHLVDRQAPPAPAPAHARIPAPARARAPELRVNQPEAAPPAPPNRQAQVEAMATQLIANANCQHPLNWGPVNPADPDRRARCEFCLRVQNKTYACRRCGLTACYGCRRHRLRG